MVKELDEQVQAFLLLPIEQVISYLFVDVSYYKIRDGA
jgi:putative transposase